jgi:hypothetical protein
VSEPKLKPIRCLLDVRDISLEHFRHPRDSQRKWKQSARGRHKLLFRLSSWADPDGSVARFSPSMDRLEKHFGHGSLYRRMDDLRDLGFLSWQREKPHYGQRQYEITVPNGVLKHLPDSPREEITPPTLVPIRLSLPSEEPPNPSRPGNWVGRLGKDIGRAKGITGNKQGNECVLALAADKGDDRVALVWGAWIKTRNLDGLTCRFFKFVEEFDETEVVTEKQAADIQEEKGRREGRTTATRTVEDSERARTKWRAVSKRLKISTSTLTTIHHRYFMETPKGKRLS